MVGSNVVHGFCYAFFFASVYIFVDEYFPKDARASAQGLFNLLILGLGPFVGNLLWGRLGDVVPHGGGHRLLAAVPGARAASAWLAAHHPVRGLPARRPEPPPPRPQAA